MEWIKNKVTPTEDELPEDSNVCFTLLDDGLTVRFGYVIRNNHDVHFHDTINQGSYLEDNVDFYCIIKHPYETSRT